MPNHVRQLLHVIVEIAKHTIVTAVVLTAIWLIEQLGLYYFGGDKVLLGKLPFTYLIDLMDIVALTTFFVLGTWSAIKKYREYDD